MSPLLDRCFCMIRRIGLTEQDLAYLNRDLSKVIVVDTNAEHSALQPENAIIIKPWEGKGGERGLIDLIPFLECTSPPTLCCRYCSFMALADSWSHRNLQPARCTTHPESIRGQRYPHGIRQEGSRVETRGYRRMGT